MANEAPSSPADRIDRAIARIEAAHHIRLRAERAMTDRHAALRARVAEAVATLDDVIASGSGD